MAKEVSVTVENGTLVLQGRRSFAQVTAKENFYCHERRAGHFARRLRLPTSVNHGQIRAEFRDGVLRVTLPKLAEEQHERGR
ncbi:MAG TPA: Hsp20/alpha crystallin family protein [Candidatus Binatia bacterium]|jgi:HSP20 family protein|nr:Hsp20/alpha crystallin family protein [Candidatus Binatia bacterium]